MTTRRNDKTSAPGPKDQESSADKKLLTSEDLFGEMVDGPPKPDARAAAARQTAPPPRKGPIKVQVSEPGARKASPLSSPPAAGETLPEDVAALLDAFSEPAESALREEESSSEPASAPATDGGVDELVDESPVPSGADAGLDALLGAPPAAEPVPITAADADEDVLLEVLEPPATKPIPRAAIDEAEARRDLLNLRPASPRAPKPSPPPRPPAQEEPVEAIKPAARITTKFTAATPKKQAEPVGGGLDLAALAEDAFSSATAPEPAPAPAPPAAEGKPQRTYGPYRLLERIAVGGMAEVFRAKRSGVEGFEKVVAVKRILSHLSDNKEFVDMFIDEAKMVAGLTHPNIVQIFDLGKIEKNYYIAMEYVHGRDLRTILRRAKERNLRIPLDISTFIVSKVCSALEYAHRKKDDRGQPILLVHRDVSPQNILISFEGEVKLTDFGIAKAATKAKTTDKGALRGKLLYMSPEQAWGKPMDRRSDVFSLGVVFYEMLTEQKPFLGTSEMSILETVRECKVPPPTTLNPRIPEKLEKVVMKALERDPETRYQDAGEMHHDLERVLHEWQPATATGLVRFLEVLFDATERGDASAEGAPGSSASLDEFREPTGEPAAAEPPAPPKDPMSIQKLLKRFGIK